MDRIKQYAMDYQQLLDVKYLIKLGRKGILTEIELYFTKKEFWHLVGLHKLKDITNLKQDRSKLFDLILAGKITDNMIQNSSFFKNNLELNYGGIEDRFNAFQYFQQLLDSNQAIFKYSPNKSKFSKISAEFLIVGKDFSYNPNTLYLFLDKDKVFGRKYCCSFFPKTAKDYTFNQTSMTLLYKEKIRISTGESEIQLNKLK